MRTRTRTLILGGLLAAMLSANAVPAVAGPTCQDFLALGIEVHGQHVVRDYVTGGGAAFDWPPSGGAVGAAVAGSGAVTPGGPGPGYHFEHGFAPGASFCLAQSRAPGFHAGQ
jgi:hypothetical protein